MASVSTANFSLTLAPSPADVWQLAPDNSAIEDNDDWRQRRAEAATGFRHRR